MCKVVDVCDIAREICEAKKMPKAEIDMSFERFENNFDYTLGS